MATCDGYDDGNFRQTKHRGTKVDGDLLYQSATEVPTILGSGTCVVLMENFRQPLDPLYKVGVPEPTTDQMGNSSYLSRCPLPSPLTASDLRTLSYCLYVSI
jgi:hypothetical protein